ncbi:MAG: sirohydrochlorin chelatase [Planctomycetales bacterium]|nr:sirohydrochlorin chelatase [Planctomycetales bacterium]
MNSSVKGFLFVGHGTRSLFGQSQMHQLFVKLKSMLEPELCALGFLELAKPDLESAIIALSEQGVEELVVIPVLLFSAGHAELDIPTAVHEAAKRHGIARVHFRQPLGAGRELVELSGAIFRSAVCEENQHCQSCCEGKQCCETSYLLVGRGSSSATATQAMLEFARHRHKLTPTPWHAVAFVFGQKPSLSDGLQLLRDSGQPTLVVQPHLLFFGSVFDQIRQEVMRYHQDNPHQRWIITQPLGASQQLANIFYRIATS